MFCMKCGKELDDSAQYCSGCGTAVGEKESHMLSINVGKVTPNFLRRREDNLPYRILMAVITILIIISGFLPILEARIKIFGWDFTSYITSTKWNLLNIWQNVDTLGDAISSANMVKLKIAIILALLSYGICVIMGFFFIKGFFTGKQRKDLTMWVSAVCIAAEVAYIIIFWLRLRINDVAASFYSSKEIISYTTIGWVLLFLPIVNLIISRQYLGTCIKIDNDNSTKEKICLLCKTSYVIGSKCPNCGSTATEEI